MDADVKAVMHECTKASGEQRVSVPQVVTKLMEAGIERHHGDLLRSQKTYCLPNGESEVVPSDPVKGVPAKDFSAAGVEAGGPCIMALPATAVSSGFRRQSDKLN